MSRINCETTEDLIPLYVDKVLSQSSVELVEEHLAECEKCTQKVNALTGDTVIKSYDDKKPLTKIKKSVRNHKLTIAIVVISAFFVILGLNLLFHIMGMISLDYAYDEVKDNFSLVSGSDISQIEGTMLLYNGKHKKFNTHSLITVVGEKNKKKQVEVTVFMERSAYDEIDLLYYLNHNINTKLDDIVYLDESVAFADDFYDDNGHLRYNFHSLNYYCDEDNIFESMEIVRLYYGKWNTYSANYVTRAQSTGERHLLWAKAGYEE